MNRDNPDNGGLPLVPGQFQYRLLDTTATTEEIIPPIADSQLEALIRLNFTRLARNVTVRACAITVRWGATEMTVEHMLLGILEWESLPSFIPDAPESQVLTQAVEAGLTPGSAPRPDALPVTSGVHRIIERAAREAQERGYERIGVGPLLIGITLESSNSAQECLTRYGITYERLRSSLPLTAFTD